MAKMRVHELAKEIEIQSKDLVAALSEAGIEGKTPSSSLEEDQIELIRKKFAKKAEKKEPAKKEAAKAEPEKKEAEKKFSAPFYNSVRYQSSISIAS